MNKQIGWLAIAWVIAMGTVVLLGWQFDIDWLKRGVADSPATMKANTASSFLLSGVALGLLQIHVSPVRYQRWCDRWIQGSVAAIGLLIISIGGLTIAQYLGGWDFGIDQALFPDPRSEALTPFPGRMAINTACNFVLIGVVFLLLLSRSAWRVWTAQLLSGVVATISGIAFLGYLFQSQVFYTVLAQATGMAVHTALTFGILSLGLLALRPDQGLMQPLSSPLMGGRMVRQVLPWIVIGPIGLSYVLIQAEYAGWYDHRFGRVLETSILILAFSAFLWRNARSLNQSEHELLHANQVLEQRVVERTQILTQLNQRLHRSEARLQDILNTAIASITISRLFPDGRVIYDYRSAGSAAIFGYTADELMATPILWRSRVLAEDWDRVIQPAQQQIPEESTVAYEYRFRHKEGAVRWIASTQTSRWHALDACWVITSVDVDITPHKQVEAALRDSEEKFRQLVDNLHEVFWISEPWNQQLLYISPAFETIWGIAAERVYENWQVWLDAIHPDDRPHITQCLATILNHRYDEEYRIITADGSIRWIRDRGFPIRNSDGQITGIAGLAEDITQRKYAAIALQQRAKQEYGLRQITERIRRSLDLADVLHTTVVEVQQLLNAGRVLIYQLQPDGTGTIRAAAVAEGQESISDRDLPTDLFSLDRHLPYPKHQICRVADLSPDALSHCRVDPRRDWQERSQLVVPIQSSVASQQDDQPESLWGVLIAQHCSPARQWQATESELLQQIAGQVAIGIQQSELYQQLQTANQQLALLATIDELTQLANRRRFDSYLQQEWQRLMREQEPLSLVFCDVDYFKKYNDTYGHLSGDECLIQVAAVMRQQVKRATDLVARYGGEEFAIILPNTTLEGAIQVVEAVQTHIRQLTLSHPTSLVDHRITLSFGITNCIPKAHSTPDDLIHKADQALYDAKYQGRDRYCIR